MNDFIHPAPYFEKLNPKLQAEYDTKVETVFEEITKSISSIDSILARNSIELPDNEQM